MEPPPQYRSDYIDEVTRWPGQHAGGPSALTAIAGAASGVATDVEIFRRDCVFHDRRGAALMRWKFIGRTRKGLGGLPVVWHFSLGRR